MIAPTDIIPYRKRLPLPAEKIIYHPFSLDPARRKLHEIPPDELASLCTAARLPNAVGLIQAKADEARAYVAKRRQTAQARADLAPSRLAAIRPDLYPFQADAARRFIADEFGAILYKPGVGKTRTTIEILHLRGNPRMRVLWVCPRQVFDSIQRELSTPRYAHYTSIVCNGSGAEKLRKLQAPTPRNFYLVNYHAFQQDAIVAQIAAMNFDVCILDEGHSIAAARNEWTKNILSISHTFKVRFILTGTFAKAPSDVWSQITFLDHGELCGNNYYDWQRQAVVVNEYNRRQAWVEAWKAKVDAWLTRHAVFAELHDIGPQPQPIEHRVTVELGPEETRVYNEMRKDFIAILDDKEIAAEVKIKQLNYLRQITGGGMYLPAENEDDERREYKVLGDSKLGALTDFLAQYPNERILIGHAYRMEAPRIEAACKAAGRTVAVVNGATSDEDSARLCREFSGGSVDCMIMQANKGVGIDGLQNDCAIVVHYSRVYGWRANEQFRGRLVRGGQKRAVLIVDLQAVVVAKDELKSTIDAGVLESINNQYDDAEAIVAVLRRTI